MPRLTLVDGRPIEPQPRPTEIPKTYPSGRRCSDPECKALLSIYNRGPSCHACRYMEPEVTIESLMAA